MRKKLKEICTNEKSFVRGLKENGKQHRNYRLYLPMAQALDFLNTGILYLSDGSVWNDIPDREQMREKKAYGKCFSCSTEESVAMWMLYGGDRGKSGAALNFLPSVMEELTERARIEAVFFTKNTGTETRRVELSRGNDFELCLMDVVYTEQQKNDEDKFRITVGEEHYSNLSGVYLKKVFCKDYAWHYEAECRLAFLPKKNDLITAKAEEYAMIRLRLSERSLKEMRKDRLIRSPVYKGRIDSGISSKLTKKVSWNL